MVLTDLQTKRVADELIAASCVKRARLDLDGHEAAGTTGRGMTTSMNMDDDAESSSSRDTLESSLTSLSELSQLSVLSGMDAGLSQAVPESSQKGKGKSPRRRQTIAQAVARPRRNRRRGCLEVLLNMPVEIFCEVSFRFKSIA